MTKRQYTTEDSDLKAEWSRHNRARNAGRGRKQADYETQFEPLPIDEAKMLERGYVKVTTAGGRGYQWEKPVEIKVAEFLVPAVEPAAELSIFDLARTCIQEHSQWYSGQTRIVWEGGTHKATVTEGGSDGGGLLYLSLHNGKPGSEASVQAGILNPRAGWQFTLTRAQYDRWVAKAQRL